MESERRETPEQKQVMLRAPPFWLYAVRFGWRPILFRARTAEGRWVGEVGRGG